MQEVGFERFPRGWTRDSVRKFAKTLAGDPKTKDWFYGCVKKIKGHVGNPEAFCAAVKDEVYGGDKAATYWRGKGKTKKGAEKRIATMRRKLKK